MRTIDSAVMNPHRTAFRSIVVVWDFLEEDTVPVLTELLLTDTEWTRFVAFTVHTMILEVISVQPAAIAS